MVQLSMKIKDATPNKTVAKIRNILRKLDLFPIERYWGNPTKNLYWVSLEVPELGIFSNGKGVDHELALASAYGEFIERLGNGLLYSPILIDKFAKEKYGFYYFPDEEFIEISKLTNILDEETRKAYEFADNEGNALDYLDNFLVTKNTKKGLICFPFWDLRKNNKVYIPSILVQSYYGSNGMCAGNTMEEALVEGLSEILERFVNIKILTNDIRPPIIPEEFLKKYFPNQYNTIKNIERNGIFKITVKDCSLGINLPVIGLILVDTKSKKYIIKFGAHPIPQIALERCLTELVQGRSLLKFDGLSYFIPHKLYDNEFSWRIQKILKEGTGEYPFSFFREGSYKFEYHPMMYHKNIDLLNYLVKLVWNLDKSILVRSNSYFGFPTYQIIIPGISETTMFSKEDFELLIGQRTHVLNLIRRIQSCSKEEIKIVIDYVEKRGEEESMTTIAGLPLLSDSLWANITPALFLANLYYKIGDLSKSVECLDRYINYLKNINSTNEIINYYECCKDFLNFKKTNDDNEQEMESFLKLLHGEEISKEVINDLKKPENSLQYLENITCFNCSKCDLREKCNYKKLRKSYLKVKKFLLKQKGDQTQLTKLSDILKPLQNPNSSDRIE
ncbi:MAG: YcaO-like family protein [Caldisericum sp.]|uniref:YcaO-like family protein n=1 Tax=Caldisericum sp. TaxID=2499687 RepID=UPI003D0B48CB